MCAHLNDVYFSLLGNSSTKAALLEELKIEIRDLIADYPEGVWCTDLISLYRLVDDYFNSFKLLSQAGRYTTV